MAMIEREAFRSELLSLTYYGDGEYYIGREAERDAIIDRLNKQPTIDAAPVVHGRWIYNTERNKWVCDKCNAPAMPSREQFEQYNTKFCPNCGARMDEMKGGTDV